MRVVVYDDDLIHIVLSYNHDSEREDGPLGHDLRDMLPRDAPARQRAYNALNAAGAYLLHHGGVNRNEEKV